MTARANQLLASISLFFLLGLFVATKASVAPSVVTTKCEFYNHSHCGDWVDGQEPCAIEECTNPGEGKRNHCFVLWSITDTGEPNVTMKGCFLNNEDCYDKYKCIERGAKAEYKYCCCEGSMCNQNFSWVPTNTESSTQGLPSTIVPMIAKDPTSAWIIIMVYCVFAVLMAAIIFGIFMWCRNRKMYFNELPTSELSPMAPPSPCLGMRPIQLIEIKARGRFGAVWKAMFKAEEIAVKIFPIQDKQSWQTEQEIYKLPYMQHPNILHYIGVEKHGDNLQAEFWLITEYHPLGSLCDFLKVRTLSWNELCRIAETMARGLMHLHEAIPGKFLSDPIKPAIAHRDFKSKNVLLKSNMTACIADFGLALVFESGKSCGDTHGQVGTRRYMAPEVLEGAISFTPDAFLRIDMYACGLVLWELVSRCCAQDGPVPEYRLPFEEEVGPHPTLEDMQESVVQRKVRPSVPESWRHHLGLSALCDTMEECWDHDAEARLSASCVMERVLMQERLLAGNINALRGNDSPLTPLKENIIA